MTRAPRRRPTKRFCVLRQCIGVTERVSIALFLPRSKTQICCGDSCRGTDVATCAQRIACFGAGHQCTRMVANTSPNTSGKAHTRNERSDGGPGQKLDSSLLPCWSIAASGSEARSPRPVPQIVAETQPFLIGERPKSGRTFWRPLPCVSGRLAIRIHDLGDAFLASAFQLRGSIVHAWSRRPGGLVAVPTAYRSLDRPTRRSGAP